jgi:hypothetical protein
MGRAAGRHGGGWLRSATRPKGGCQIPHHPRGPALGAQAGATRVRRCMQQCWRADVGRVMPSCVRPVLAVDLASQPMYAAGSCPPSIRVRDRPCRCWRRTWCMPRVHPCPSDAAVCTVCGGHKATKLSHSCHGVAAVGGGTAARGRHASSAGPDRARCGCGMRWGRRHGEARARTRVVHLSAAAGGQRRDTAMHTCCATSQLACMGAMVVLTQPVPRYGVNNTSACLGAA